jgi:YbbR domain-containing protein
MMPWMDHIKNNFWMKMFSLALAILIWLAVNSRLENGVGFSLNPWNSMDTRDFDLPVSLLIYPDQGQTFVVNPARVQVTVQGESKALEGLTSSDILAYVRLNDTLSPLGTFPLEVKPPRDFTVKAYGPRRVSVETAPGSPLLFPPGPVQ